LLKFKKNKQLHTPEWNTGNISELTPKFSDVISQSYFRFQYHSTKNLSKSWNESWLRNLD